MILDITVDPNDTIEHVKTVIQDVVGIPAKEQCLIFFNRECADPLTISDCGIRNRSLIDLMLRAGCGRQGNMRIFVCKFNGEILRVIAHSEETIYTLKRRICLIDGIIPGEQRLIFNDGVYPDDSKLTALGIKNGSVLSIQSPEKMEELFALIKKIDTTIGQIFCAFCGKHKGIGVRCLWWLE